MTDEPTELDKQRAAYVEQIIHHVRNAAKYPDHDVKFLVDNLLMEWGAKAFQAGRKDLAAVVSAMVK